MQIIVDFLGGIGDAIVSAFDWLVSTVQDIAYFGQALVDYVAAVPSFFTWLPPEVLTVIVAGLGVLVLLRILGRD